MRGPAGSSGHPGRDGLGLGTRGASRGRARPSPQGGPLLRKDPVVGATISPLSDLQSLLTVYRPDLATELTALDAPAYRYQQVYEHLFLRPGEPFAQATALPIPTRIALDSYGESTLSSDASRTATDGTTKLLLSGSDGLRLETVLMPYRDRSTVCVSSQVGCPVGCAFCATGAMGFRRNLVVGEIVDQVRMAASLAGRLGRRVSNVVFMGMGEPLLNLQAVLDSIRILTDPHGLNLAHRSISISTIGIPGGILRLARTEPQVNLALSLHAADDRTRARLVPPRFRHPLAEILDAAWEHFAITRRKLLVEYVLIKGVNDSHEDAHRLAGLLRGRVVTVNLLAWNPILRSTGTLSSSEPDPAKDRRANARDLNRPILRTLAAPSRASVAGFRDTLSAAGVKTVIRHSKGSRIGAACGQLAAQHDSYFPYL